MLRYEPIPARASAGASSTAAQEGAAIGVGIAIVALGGFATWQLYQHRDPKGSRDQIPTAAIAAIGTIALAPRIAASIA